MSGIGAIGSTVFPGQAGAGKSGAALEAQLAQYQIQLADWVSCPSCNTPEGKAKIQDLSNRVSETQRSIKAAEAPSQGSRPGVQAAASIADGRGSVAVPTLNVVGSGGLPPTLSAQSNGTLGTRLNDFA